MKILAIETSCDETSVAIVEDGQKLHSLVINSQIDLHRAFGGVVPEIAARSHIEVVIPVITQALEEAFGSSGKNEDRRMENEEKTSTPQSSILNPQSDHWDQIDAIAVTQGPGLLGALLIGVLTARTLAWSLNKPLYPVHHIMGHVYANWLTSTTSTGMENEDRGVKRLPHSSLSILPSTTPEFPVLALIVSGGHSQLMFATNHTDWKIIGRTEDDAVGEAFDKAAKVLGLPYPGGPSIAKAAENGNPDKYHLTTPKVATVDPGLIGLREQLTGDSVQSGTDPASWPLSPGHSLNFSFSGLKTGFLRAIQKECGKPHDFPSFELAALLNDVQKADFAASFQKTAINYLVSKTKLAYEDLKPKSLIIGGGVAASLPLRKALSKEIPLEIAYAPQILCTDNAAMIGARAYYQSLTEDPADPRVLDPKPSWPL